MAFGGGVISSRLLGSLSRGPRGWRDLRATSVALGWGCSARGSSEGSLRMRATRRPRRAAAWRPGGAVRPDERAGAQRPRGPDLRLGAAEAALRRRVGSASNPRGMRHAAVARLHSQKARCTCTLVVAVVVEGRDVQLTVKPANLRRAPTCPPPKPSSAPQPNLLRSSPFVRRRSISSPRMRADSPFVCARDTVERVRVGAAKCAAFMRRLRLTREYARVPAG